jgi:hypothetical protein
MKTSGNEEQATTENKVTFNSLKIGDSFIYEKDKFKKISINMAREPNFLGTGKFKHWCFRPDDLVTKLN